MSAFTNVANTEDKLLVDAHNLSAIVETKMKRGEEEQWLLSFSSFEESSFLHIELKNWDVDPDNCVAAVRSQGTTLIELPHVWGDGTPLGRVFVNPDAFNYIVTSAPHIGEGDSEEHVAILMGIDGYGLVESYHVPVSKVDELMQAVSAVKPNLKRIDTDRARARFYDPGYVVYDPQKVSRIYQNGYDVDVMFENGLRVDFQLNTGVDNIVAHYIQRKFHSLPEEEKDKLFESGKIDDLQKKAYIFEKKFRGRLRQEFARAVANDTKLVPVASGYEPFYTRLENVSWINRHENRLAFQYKKSSPEGQGMSSVSYAHFPSEEKAQAALSALQTRLSGPTGP